MIPSVMVVDDDEAVRESLGMLLETAGFKVHLFADAETFLVADVAGSAGCLVLDVRMPGMGGLGLQDELARRSLCLPIVFISAYDDIPIVVRAIKSGAIDFLTKPVDGVLLIQRVRAAFAQNTRARQCFALLTERERQVLRLAVSGLSNKEIARSLGISHRTVETHRARVFEKTGAANLLELANWCEACSISPPSQRFGRISVSD